jgi:hypothetical protein
MKTGPGVAWVGVAACALAGTAGASPLTAMNGAVLSLVSSAETLRALARAPSHGPTLIIVPSRQAPSRPVVFGPAEGRSPAPAIAASIPPRVSGAIEVPSNTLGPGEPLWMRRERESAEARLAVARADDAERHARAPLEERRFGAWTSGGGIGGVFPGGRVFHGGVHPDMPPIGTTFRFNDRTGAAQRGFANAATPPIGGIVGGQLDAQRKIFTEPAPR